MKEIKDKRNFIANYQLIMNGKPVPVILRAALVEESDGKKLIVGVIKDE